MTNHLEPDIIKNRTRLMIDTARKMKYEYDSSFINQTMDILIEQKKGDFWIGHTSNYLEVYCKSSLNNLDNTIHKCNIIEIKNGILYGIIRGE